MANRKRRTEAQKAFQKERRRLLQAIRRGEKQGYIFQENLVPDLPKRVTKTALKRIQKTKPKDLYKTAEYLYQDTGEVVPAEQRKQEVKREATRKAKETRKYRLTVPLQESTNTPGFIPPESISEDDSLFDTVVIANFKAHVKQFNEHASNLLLSWLDKILAKNDVHDVATMLNDGAEAGLIVSYQIVYAQDKLTQYMSEMLDYLPEAGSLFKAEIMDAMEEEESFSSPL